jgi:hypothetical protein
MGDGELPPAADAGDPSSERRAPLVSRGLVRNLAIVLVIVGVVVGFGRPLAAGYYFGGCDNAETAEHYVIHVFGVAMCRDVPIASEAETRATREAQTISPSEELEAEEGAPPAQSPSPPAGAGEGAPS